MVWKCCNEKFLELSDYAKHIKQHQIKCKRCDGWLCGLEEIIQHRCRNEQYAINLH